MLTPQEADQLFQTVRQMAAKGKAIIFITHKLDEVMAIADRITVLLRGGEVVGYAAPAKRTEAELARLMVGREVAFPAGQGRPASRVKSSLDSRGPAGPATTRGLPALTRTSRCAIRAGEILGIAGVAGNGQRELAEVITGLRKATERSASGSTTGM